MKNKSWEAESNKLGNKSRQRNWRLAGRSLAILLVISFTAGNGWGRHQVARDASEQLHLTVGVYERLKGLAKKEERSMQVTTRRILEKHFEQKV